MENDPLPTDPLNIDPFNTEAADKVSSGK